MTAWGQNISSFLVEPGIADFNAYPGNTNIARESSAVHLKPS
jgi:hypothetical protein